MTPLAVFLLACATIFLGCVEAAFSALMRLSLRLMAERGGRDDRLGHYLDEPLSLFVPVRLLIGACLVITALFLAPLTDVHNARAGDDFDGLHRVGLDEVDGGIARGHHGVDD